MLKKLVAAGLCAMIVMACETTLDPTDPKSIKKYFEKQAQPIKVDSIQFVKFVSSNDTANMKLFLVCNEKFLDKPNEIGNNALSVAVNKKNAVMVKFLLDRGAEVTIKSQLGLPVEDAATRKDTTGILKMLIEAHKAKYSDEFKIGQALHLAAGYGMLENVKTFIESGVNPNAKNSEGLTPLHEAAKSGKKAVVEYLISINVDINALDNKRLTPTDYSEFEGEGTTYPEIAKILKAAGGKHSDVWKKAFP